ncbi:MAG TPA: YojF family protein [Symbiobacteriaceae bacterium]|nr:YojF family protein [Symbiobacteriaceae bacterium]
MKPIALSEVQAALQPYVDREVYLHLETTNGAYAAENLQGQAPTMAVCAYIRNARVRFHRAVIAGAGPFRAGLQMEIGWIYAEGLTDWEIDEHGRLLLAGHDVEGRLAVALELSFTPFHV